MNAILLRKKLLRISRLMGWWNLNYHYLLFQLHLTEFGQFGNGSTWFLVKSKIKKINPISFYYSHQQVIFAKEEQSKTKNNGNAGRLWNIVSKDAAYFVQWELVGGKLSKFMVLLLAPPTSFGIAHQLHAMKSESFCFAKRKCTIERVTYESVCSKRRLVAKPCLF